ncbi:MAG: minor capsid protein [Acutalibacteraceae bacterium]|nr:minor capsid protein [Acutalibacteraceae bacterium]
MLNALRTYLIAQGYKNVYCDFMPKPDTNIQAINITKWGHNIGSINDGTGTHYIQIQCRDIDYSSAFATCKQLFNLLDSGVDETLIHLTPDVFCIARPRRGPLIYERSNNYTIAYCEVALWGEN